MPCGLGRPSMKAARPANPILRRNMAPETIARDRTQFRLPMQPNKWRLRTDMTLVSEHIETDTREKILVVAERLFRQMGYQKTTVADIAKELRMSPANVYRFFDSKKSIHE